MKLAEAYINVKFGATRGEILAVRKMAGEEIKALEAKKAAVYENGPSVHGRREQSQLDIIDMQLQKAYGVFDNCDNMALKAVK